ncbi:hypothetical protein DL89DRAFT_65774 [Linderina pennispora]|uniref:Uncharacterized protein n=1 Tax=Linderina pennispora TaxID=61395 RepID=A0A1Y1VZF8_9FUNG|nr:uncharacterized protein DL89DRAFT_65774 [Linderina pennispora]ORX66639.1 hypothetical protein DL89DRAFT_65774 [Linderina pennispora]
MLLKSATALLTLATAVLGHMEITYPCPRYSPRCATRPTLPPGQSFDYNLNVPAGSNGNINSPICHHDTPWPQANEVWTAGETVSVKFNAGGATHSGGHCEFSVSYDGGQTFVVLYQRLRYCFFTSAPSQGGTDSVRTYTFNLPATLPGAPRVTFLWSWVNAVGNREFYSNCADVAIKGAAGSYTGKKVTIANYGAGYPVIPEFLGNYETGISYYMGGTQVTVSGPGFDG